MKKSNAMLIVGFLGAGATIGYLNAKEKKGKKPLDKMALGAIAGGLVGLLATHFTKEESSEIKLSIPENINIERT